MKYFLVLFASCLIFGGCTSKPSSTPAPITNAYQSPANVATESKPVGTQVFINGHELTQQEVDALTATYHYPPLKGHFWYDTMSGAWGAEGREPAGFLLPGHDFGPLSPRASNGNTGVFINGREINMVEAGNIQRTFGAVYQGRWWIDGRTGNYGVEGNPMPVGNILAALRAQSSSRNGDNFWSTGNARGNSSGGCSYVSVDGATATSGCD